MNGVILKEDEWNQLKDQITSVTNSWKRAEGRFQKYAYYQDQLDEFIQIVEAYNVDIDGLIKIARLAAIIDTERNNGYAFKLLREAYSKYHQWTEEQ